MIEVNGVTLPDIPEVEGYPYALIVEWYEGGEHTGMWLLYVVNSPYYVITKEVSSNDSDKFYSTGIGYQIS